MESYDKRKLKRRHLIYYLRVFDQKTEKLLGHLVDITSEGIMLVSEQPIEINRPYKVRMALPTEILKREFMVFEAVSLWTKRDVNPDFFATGFSISGVAEEDVVVVERLINRYGFND
jgi:hypothetical protein